MWRTYVELPRSIHILCLGMLINKAGSFVLVFLTIYVTRELEAGPAFAAQCMGVFGAGSMVASLVGGQLADQVGRRVVILTSLFGGAIVLCAMSVIREPWAFMASIAVFALFVEMYRPAASAMMGDLVEDEQRPHAFGLMYISMNLGFAVGPPVGGLLAGWSYQWLFLVDASTTAAFAVIIFLLIPETKPAAGTSDARDAVGSRKAPSDVVSLGQAAKHISGDWTFLVLCLATLMSAIVFMQGTTTLPIHIQSTGLDSFDFGLLIGINGAMIFVCQLPMTHALAPFNRMGVIIIGEVLIACGFALTTFADSFGFFALTIVIWTSGEIMNAAFGQTIITDLAPVELRARYMGVFSMTYSVALMIGAPVGGIILERYGAPTLWTAGGFLGVLSVVLHTSIFWSVTQRLTPESDVQNREDTDQTD